MLPLFLQSHLFLLPPQIEVRESRARSLYTPVVELEYHFGDSCSAYSLVHTTVFIFVSQFRVVGRWCTFGVFVHLGFRVYTRDYISVLVVLFSLCYLLIVVLVCYYKCFYRFVYTGHLVYAVDLLTSLGSVGTQGVIERLKVKEFLWMEWSTLLKIYDDDQNTQEKIIEKLPKYQNAIGSFGREIAVCQRSKRNLNPGKF